MNAAPTGTGLVSKTGSGTMKVASDLSASTTLAGIHVDAGAMYIESGKAPDAPIAVASSAVMELGAGLAAGSIGGAVTIASGAEMLVDANATVPHQNITDTYTFNTTTGYYNDGSSNAAWPTNLTSYYGDIGGGLNWLTTDSSDQNISYMGIHLVYDPRGAIGHHYWAPAGNFTPQAVMTGSDIFTGTLGFSSGSKLALGPNSTWARDITVGTPS